jgi:outer membrane immunogenic protein
MRKLVLFGIIFSVIALARPAHADGTWAGFYIGGNVGYAWGTGNSTLSIVDGPTVLNCHFCDNSDIGAAQSAGSPSFDPKGFTGGGQFGYNWQVSNWVYGAELDFEAFSQRQTINNSVNLPVNPFSSSCLSAQCAANFSTSVKTDWLLTIRPRIGYAWDQTLVYVTGGLAFTRLSLSQSYNDNINLFAAAGGSLTTSASQTKAGWVIGGGLEQAIGAHWSLKAEYLYVRFDGLSANGTLMHAYPTFGGGTAPDFASFTNNLDHLSSSIVRVGINYRFAASPAVAKY